MRIYKKHLKTNNHFIIIVKTDQFSMIKLFRKIRQKLLSGNKLSNYLLYAFGEILLVVIGILIALKVNNWNESRKTLTEVKTYISSFYDENITNQESLESALSFSKTAKTDIDTLKAILLNREYTDIRIKSYIGSMMALSNFSPSTTTMENISASGEFDLITDINLRKNIISTYNSFKTTTKLEVLLETYVNEFLTPFLLENLRFSDFSSINSDFIKNPIFENIVLGYDALLIQEINGYEKNLERLKQLNENLSQEKSKYND